MDAKMSEAERRLRESVKLGLETEHCSHVEPITVWPRELAALLAELDRLREFERSVCDVFRVSYEACYECRIGDAIDKLDRARATGKAGT